MLPPLADVSDLRMRTGEAYEGDDRLRAEAVLTDASNLIRDEAGKTWVNTTTNAAEPPDAIFSLALKVARRALDNPEGLTSETHPEYSWRKDGAEDGVYLTERECRICRRNGGKSGLCKKKTTRLDEENATVWVEDEYGSEPFPMYAIEDLA